MAPPIEAMLARAVSLLRDLPRKREEVGAARRQFARFSAMYPKVQTDLLVDQPPGSPQVDYDLFLAHPDGGTVALSWQADDAMPWPVVHADHWAANYVMSVDNHHVTIQQALLFLKLASGTCPDLMTEMVEQTLIAQAIGENPPPVSEPELQAAADEFRRANLLDSAAATHRWLKETGLSLPRFEELLRRLIQREKLEEQITKERIEPYFRAHRKRFEFVRFCRVDTADQSLAKRLISPARKKGLLSIIGSVPAGMGDRDLTESLLSRYAFELPPALANAKVGKVIGPVAEGRGFWVAEALQRRPARLDAETTAIIRDQIFREWLAERHNQATVCWHWI
jgi:putative peptide maturation system protein